MYSEGDGSEGSQLSGCCYVAVLGMAGSGKTKFIADLLEHVDLRDDCGLTGGTRSIIAHRLDIFGQPVHLLDTPGFDNTHLTDADVINQVKQYIQQRSILDGSVNALKGVVYLHRISSPRFAGSSVGALTTLRTLCGGETAANRIQFLTTFWDEVEESQGRYREAELRSKPTMLKELLDEGSTLQRTPDSSFGKRAILAALLDPSYRIDTSSVSTFEMPGAWPEQSDEIATKPPLRIAVTPENSLDLVSTKPLSPAPPLFGAERAALAMREASLKSREEILRVRELDLTAEYEKQRLVLVVEQTKLQKTFEERLEKERAAFQSALSTEYRHRTELDVQIRGLRELRQAQARICEAKDQELKDMSKTVTDAITIAHRQKQDRLRRIGADHETMMHFHLFRDLAEIVSCFRYVMISITARKGPEAISDIVSELISSGQSTESCFDNTTPCCHPVTYLTRGTWKGFYWNTSDDPDELSIGSTMRGIKFHAVPISTQESGLYQIRAASWRDEAGSYSISGTFDVSQAHENGRMILQATKDYGTHCWHWDLRASPHGFLGLWGSGKDREKVKRFWGFKHSSPGEWDGVGGIHLVKEV